MFVSPMLLSKRDEPFNDDKYITELKFDGIRLIYTKFNDKPRLYTRHQNEVTSLFPELTRLEIPNGTALDGEVIATNDAGHPDFELMMERFSSNKSNIPIQYCLFDALYYDNKKITHLPLLDRKEYMNECIPSQQETLLPVQWIVGQATEYFELVKRQNLEGIVQKRASSTYQIGKRSKDWLKVINYHFADVSVVGVRKAKFGLLLAYKNGDYAGVMEFMTQNKRKEFYQRYRAYISSETDAYYYLNPGFPCRVKFRNYTKTGKLRIPSFVEWID